MAKVDVVGAGMAGLLAAAMLRKQCHKVVEAAPELPNNHSAVLRFRSSVVADTLNIPFKRVKAVKAVDAWRNPIADAMAYSVKTNGTATLRSVLTADGQAAERFIAPAELIARMADMVEAPIEFGHEYPFWAHQEVPTISTIPMPLLMDELGYDREINFRYRAGHNVIARLEGVDAYCSLYVPDPAFPAARISITGSELIAECYGGKKPGAAAALGFAQECAERMGIHHSCVLGAEVKEQRYAKILPIDEDERRRFIMWASEHHNVYALGRFATWRPGLLLDDVVNDVRVIQRLIANRGESYPHKLKG